MRIAITIPVYLNVPAHLDYLNQTTRSFQTTHELYFIPVLNRRPSTFPFDHYEYEAQIPDKVIELEGRQNPQAVSKAWNDGIARAVEHDCEYIIIMNEDIILGKKSIDNLVAYAEAHKKTEEDLPIVIWSMSDVNQGNLNDETEGAGGGPHFSSFMVHKTFPEVMGKFDENIAPAYFEDNDMQVRIVKSGHRAVRCTTSKFFHYGSTTLNSDSQMRAVHPPQFGANEAYFIQKWGNRVLNTFDEILNQMYKTPFNIPDRELNDWRPSDRTGAVPFSNPAPIPGGEVVEARHQGTGLSASAIQQTLDDSAKANAELRKNYNR